MTSTNVRFIADVDDSCYTRGEFEELMWWLHLQTSGFQIDIETDVTPWWNDKKLISLQFGNMEETEQWFVQWSALSEEEQATLIGFLNVSGVLKLAHNAKFEYIVLRFYGITLSNLYCTMVAEKVLRGGEESEEYALADISWKYLNIVMDKSLQMEFGDDIITDGKILYGVTDVKHLQTIRRQQLIEASRKCANGYDLISTINLEMGSLLSFSDITYEGMLLNVEKWRKNVALAEPVVQQAYDRMNNWLLVEPFYEYSLKVGHLADEDRMTINYNSVPQRTELLKLLFPDIAGGTKIIVQKYIKENKDALPEDQLALLENYINKDYDLMQERLVHFYKDYLVNHDYLTPKGQPTINWQSNPQVLALVQQALPKIKSLSEDERNRHVHPILKDLEDYKAAAKLLTTYGEKFIQEYVGPDGRVRTNFNQVLTTGRVSSANPNMQNIPANDNVGMRYRNSFVADKGFVFVDSDYTGQELAIIAYMSNDPVWLRAIQYDEDLHSVCAEMVYKRKWQDAAQSGCVYYEGGKHLKCSCKGHKKMRGDVKPIDFGLAYGMSKYKLANDLGISVREAGNLIDLYFDSFPSIKKLLDWLGRFGVENGYIVTLAPFNRKRHFPFWEHHRPYIYEHVNEIRYNPGLGEIERASKNLPIQGSGADMIKLALIMMRRHIHRNGLQNDIKIVMQVHDQITTMCRTEIADAWKSEMDYIMCDAAKVIIPTGILKAETVISPVWTK